MTDQNGELNNYLLRVDRELWRQVKTKAASERIAIKDLIVNFLKEWIK